MAEKSQTTQEKRLAKIAQLEAMLQKEKARLNAEKRKERNGQLIAFGIYLEEFLKTVPGQRQNIRNSFSKYLTGRNLERALAGWERISESIKLKQAETVSEEVLVVEEEDWETDSGSLEREISPEPPSQLPEAEAQEKNQGSA